MATAAHQGEGFTGMIHLLRHLWEARVMIRQDRYFPDAVRLAGVGRQNHSPPHPPLKVSSRDPHTAPLCLWNVTTAWIHKGCYLLRKKMNGEQSQLIRAIPTKLKM